MAHIGNVSCLFIGSDDEGRDTVTVHLDSKELDWVAALKKNGEARVINVHGKADDVIVLDTQYDNLLRLAMAVRANPAIKTIRFHDCMFEELGQMFMAINEPREQLPVLEFQRCTINETTAKAIAFMLRKGSVGELSFMGCTLDETSFPFMEVGLCRNKSLTRFEFAYRNRNKRTPETLLLAVQKRLKRSTSLLKLALSVSSDCNLWDIFHVVNTRATLQSLQLYHSTIEMDLMQPIMMMCVLVESFKELILTSCIFSQASIEFLVKTLSDKNVLDTFTLESAKVVEGGKTLRCPPMGTIQVRSLSLKGTKLAGKVLTQTLDELAKNHFIECLDLSNGVVRTHDAFQRLFQGINDDIGPSELIVDTVGSSGQMIAEALQDNSTLSSLSIGGFEGSSSVEFADGLAGMIGLRKLSIHFDSEPHEDFLQVLEERLKENSILHTLSLNGMEFDDETDELHLNSIRRLVAINRVGGFSMMTAASVPVGIWAKLLARVSSDADGIYFALSSKPDIVAPPRKRKDRSDDKSDS